MAEQQKNQLQDNQPQKEQDLGQLLKVRREKLATLQEAGKDPFRITKYDVTAHSRDIKENYELPRLPLFRKGSGKQNIESGKNSDTTDHLVFRLESHCVRLFGEGVQKEIGRASCRERV